MASFSKKLKVVVKQQTERFFMQKQASEGFFKKSVMRNFAEFTRNLFFGISFFDKEKLCRSATPLKVFSAGEFVSFNPV